MKKSYIILIVVILVAVLVWFLEYPKKGERGGFSPFLFYPDLAKTEIGKIEIKHLIQGVMLEKDGDGWSVSGLQTEMGKQIEQQPSASADIASEKFKADTEKVNRLFELVKEAKAVSLASTNPEKQALFQVNNLAKILTLYGVDGKRLGELYIGKNGPDLFSAYVRQDGENEVYLTGGQLGAAASADIINWRDRLIWDYAPGIIKQVDVVSPGANGGNYTLSRGETGTWGLSVSSDPLDSSKVEAFIKKMSRVMALNFASTLDDKATGFEKPVMEIVVTAEDGTAKTLLLGKTNEQGYVYGKKGGEPQVYLFPGNFRSELADWSGLVEPNKNNQ